MGWSTIAAAVAAATAIVILPSVPTSTAFTLRSNVGATFLPSFADVGASRTKNSPSLVQSTFPLRMGSSSSDIIPQSGDIVSIDCSLTPNDDFVPIPLFDLGDDIRFVLNKGNYLPAIHALVSTFKIGQSTSDTLMDAGWGTKNPQLIATVPKQNTDTDGGADGIDYNAVKVGTELYLADGTKCRVTHVTDDDFTIDANPPLAGATYRASLALRSVEPGPDAGRYPYAPGRAAAEGGDGGGSPYRVATVALGCFWGGELEYMRTPGVVGTAVGYTQGPVGDGKAPTYEEVCSGTTGYTEAIQLVYDPRVVEYGTLVRIGVERLGESRYLENQTGNDRGTQYRHGVYYHDDEQKRIAMDIIGSYGEKCVTECLPAQIFYEAEDYHQQYLLKGGQSARKDATDAIRCYG